MRNTKIRNKKNKQSFNNTDYIQYIQKDCVNIVHIPTGNLPTEKANEYLKQFSGNCKDLTDGYKVIYVAKRG